MVELAQIDIEIAANYVQPGVAAMLDQAGKSLGYMSPFGIAEKTGKLISNGDLNISRLMNGRYFLEGDKPRINDSIREMDIFVKGNVRSNVNLGSHIAASGDITIEGNARGIIGEGLANGEMISGRNIKVGELIGKATAKKGWIMAKKIAQNAEIDTPELYIPKGEKPPINYKGHTNYVDPDKWDSFTPSPVTKVSSIDGAAADLKKTIAAVGGNFAVSGEKLTVATTGNVLVGKETRRS